MINRTTFLTSTILAGLASLGSSTAFAQDAVATLEDNSSVVLSGTVAAVDDDEFTLDYGSGMIIVEMDDWDFFNDKTQALIPGERVTVTGNIDDDLFEGREVEADTVYVHDRYTYYYQDPEAAPSFQAYTFNNDTATPGGGPVTGSGVADGSWVNATGVIADISGREFTLNTGRGAIKVDTQALGYNPMDEQGFRRLNEGDRVYVTGLLDDDFFEEREIEADAVVKLTENRVVIPGPEGTTGSY